jgi:hypothetical protein
MRHHMTHWTWKETFFTLFVWLFHFRVSEVTTRRLLHWVLLLPADSQCIVPRRIAIRPDSVLSA